MTNQNSGGSRSWRRCAGALAVVVLALAPACGGSDDDDLQADDDVQPEAQPAPDVTAFAGGSFEDLPLPPRRTPVSERSEDEGVVSQSFEVRNTTAEELLAFYAEALRDFDVLEVPEQIGVGTYRGQWDIDGRELTVAAQEAETLDDNPGAPEVLTQLSLSLAAPGIDTNAP